MINLKNQLVYDHSILVDPKSVEGINKIEYALDNKYIRWLKVSYKTVATAEVIETDAMGEDIDENDDELVQSFEIEDDDRVIGIYSSYNSDYINYFKFITLKRRVPSVGNEHFDGRTKDLSESLSESQFLTSMKFCFKRIHFLTPR